MNVRGAMEVARFARVAMRGLAHDRDEIAPGLSRVLRLISRLRPRATLRAAEAARLGDR